MAQLADTILARPMLAWFQTWEIIIILLAVLLLFGGRKLPELARGLARSLRIFKEEMRGVQNDVQDAVRDDAESQRNQPAEPGERPADKPPDRKTGP